MISIALMQREKVRNMRLTDIDKLHERLQTLVLNERNKTTYTTWSNAYAEIADMVEYDLPIMKLPSARWIDGHCSNCGCDVPAYIIDWKWQKDMDANFCPNCGADMRGEKDE